MYCEVINEPFTKSSLYRWEEGIIEFAIDTKKSDPWVGYVKEKSASMKPIAFGHLANMGVIETAFNEGNKAYLLQNEFTIQEIIYNCGYFVPKHNLLHSVNLFQLANLQHLKTLDVSSSPQKSIRYLYHIIDRKIDTYDLAYCEDFIQYFISMGFSLQLHLALLTITFKIKDLLFKRKALYSVTEMLAKREYQNIEDVETVMYGLQ